MGPLRRPLYQGPPVNPECSSSSLSVLRATTTKEVREGKKCREETQSWMGKIVGEIYRERHTGRRVVYLKKTNLGRKKVKFARLNFDDGFMALMMLRCYRRSRAIMISFCLGVNNDIFQNDVERCNVFPCKKEATKKGKCWEGCS